MDNFVTERTIVREHLMEDLDDFHEYAKVPEVGMLAGWKPHESKEETRKVLEKFVNDRYDKAIILKENGKCVGSIGLHLDKCRPGLKDVVELGYCLAKPYWNQGIMTEVVSQLLTQLFLNTRIQFVSAGCYEYNRASQRVLEHNGFIYEGTLHHASVLPDGRIVNCKRYLVSRKAFFEK